MPCTFTKSKMAYEWGIEFGVIKEKSVKMARNLKGWEQSHESVCTVFFWIPPIACTLERNFLA